MEVELGANRVLIEDFPPRPVQIEINSKSKVLRAIGEAGWTTILELGPIQATATTVSENELRIHYKTDTGHVSWRMRADTEAEIAALKEALGELGVTI
jgi:hypothetical protein